MRRREFKRSWLVLSGHGRSSSCKRVRG
jgi:hypothetical protein